MKNLIEKIQNLLKKLTFRQAVIIIGGLFLILFIINFILTPKPGSENNLTVNNNNTVTDGTGKVVSYYDLIDGPSKTDQTGSTVIIYVKDLKNITGDQIKLITARVLAAKGLKENQVSIIIKQMTETLSAGGDYVPDPEQNFDPLDPSTFTGKDLAQILKYETEPMNLTFAQFVATKPNTDDYSITKDGNTYTVLLKNGYTQAQFEKEVLAQLQETNGLQLFYANFGMPVEN